MNELKKIKTHIFRPETTRRNRKPLFKTLAREIIYSPFFWLLAHYYNVPGLNIQAIIYSIGLKLMMRRKIRLVASQKLLSSPMDSVRYFEFDFFYHRFLSYPYCMDYLDVSSPRLFPALILDKFQHVTAILVNPDKKDLNITRELFVACGFEKRCSFLSNLIEGLPLPDDSFDVITSMSVIEHIPGDGDIIAIKEMWRLLKPGGKLLISVPGACMAFEEYIDYNEYGLLLPDEDSYVYGQRFYDKRLLEDRFWHMTGNPTSMVIYGEKNAGYFMRNRQEKIAGTCSYPYWREPCLTGQNYRRYASIDDLPGVGVIALEFIK